ncbi:MAG: HPr family phosphocarrier protein [Opitutaceae bacterium]|jgi:phosphotransferase system HPr (HPr) family protein
MKTIRVSIPWVEGLHMRPAGCIVAVARSFRSVVRLRVGTHVAEASSILSIVILCASLNAVVDIEASGDDEQEAVRAVAACFESPPPPSL